MNINPTIQELLEHVDLYADPSPYDDPQRWMCELFTLHTWQDGNKYHAVARCGSEYSSHVMSIYSRAQAADNALISVLDMIGEMPRQRRKEGKQEVS